jgi:hypothetical protein
MTSNRKLVTKAILFGFVLALSWLAAASSGQAQQTPPPAETDLRATNNLDLEPAPVPVMNSEANVADPADQTTGATTSEPSSKDDQWHITLTPYLWFPAFYGNLGFPNRNLQVHADAGSLLAHFRFGLMGDVDVRRKWFVAGVDMFWVRLGDNKPIPLEAGVTTANVKVWEFILTPEVGVRFVDQQRIKVDFLTGLRYWHLGTSLAFNPSALGLSFSRSDNWVDPLVGGRIQALLSDKIVLNLIGDVGGWGTGSLIDYEVGGLLGYKIKPTVTLLGGYRYLRVDYRSGLFLFNVHDPGVLFGVTINLK